MNTEGCAKDGSPEGRDACGSGPQDRQPDGEAGAPKESIASPAAAGAQEGPAEVRPTAAGWLQMSVHGVVVLSAFGEQEAEKLRDIAERINTAATHPTPAQAAPQAEMGELDPQRAIETARAAIGYSAAFDGKGIDWQSDEPWPHRIELAQALDWITELGAMVLNLADRVAAPQAPAAGAEVAPSEQEILKAFKQGVLYGTRASPAAVKDCLTAAPAGLDSDCLTVAQLVDILNSHPMNAPVRVQIGSTVLPCVSVGYVPGTNRVTLDGRHLRRREEMIEFADVVPPKLEWEDAASVVPTFEEFCKAHGLDPKKMESHGGMWARVALDKVRAALSAQQPQEKPSSARGDAHG